MHKNLKLIKKDKLAIIKIDRPKFKNSINIETSKEILTAAKTIEKDKKIVCILILGNSDSFSAGADINEIKNLNSKKAKLKNLFNYLDELEKIKIPIISAVEGYAFGGGLELLLITDFIIASCDAKFGQPEVNIGTTPGAGGTQRFTRAIGKNKAMMLALTGEMLTAREALACNLIAKVVPAMTLLQETFEVAKKIADSL